MSKKALNILEGIQNKALCKMFSVGRNTSLATLQLTTRILPMKAREKILKLKWWYRYKGMKLEDDMLLPLVEEHMKENALIPRNEEIKEFICELTGQEDTNVKEVIAKYSDRIFEESKNNVKIFSESPLMDVRNKDISRFICGEVGSRKDVHMILLFILNKIPGKPVNCRRCNERATKDHLINCNRTIWNSAIDKLYGFQEIRNCILKITDFTTTPSTWPFWLIKLITVCTEREEKETIVEELAKALRISFTNCISTFTNRMSGMF